MIVACSSSVDSFGTVRSLLSEAGLRAWPVHMGFVLVAGMVRPWGSAAHLLGNASVLWSGPGVAFLGGVTAAPRRDRRATRDLTVSVDRVPIS